MQFRYIYKIGTVYTYNKCDGYEYYRNNCQNSHDLIELGTH
jgi:hypothetical protein